MGDIVTASGTRYFIGPSGTSTQYDTIAEFEAVTVWTEIGLVEDGGEFGDEAEIVTGTALGDGRTRKAKSARDAGTLALVCFHDPLDTGQLALIAAEATNDNYTFKVIYPDDPPGYDPTIEYFLGIVSSKRVRIGQNNNIIRRMYNVAINSAIFSDPASN